MYELLTARLMLIVYSKLIEERGDRLGVREYARRVAGGWRPSFKTRLPEDVKNLITRCWAPDASTRPSIAEVLHQLERFRSGRVLDAVIDVEDRSLSGVSRFFTGWLDSFWGALVVSPCRCFRGDAKPAAPLREKLHRPELEVKSS